MYENLTRISKFINLYTYRNCVHHVNDKFDFMSKISETHATRYLILRVSIKHLSNSYTIGVRKWNLIPLEYIDLNRIFKQVISLKQLFSN